MVCIEETSNQKKPVKAKDLLEIVGSIYWNRNLYNSEGASNPKSYGNVGNPTLFPKRIIGGGLRRPNKVRVTLKSPRTIAAVKRTPKSRRRDSYLLKVRQVIKQTGVPADSRGKCGTRQHTPPSPKTTKRKP
ncbi:hypothetical protein CDAR_25901 [Caerostris darwini]|uniref:Ribosomal protein S13 n=1 Tax=Caerostris darwini TaxID=1538125 RepID=A0AAV4PIP1_9ARAC|nr:hypothetical protein CDAR_25901 [Caerostris darwini]